MAQLTINQKSFDLPDGSPIGSLCQSQGVPFNCNTGVCGSCIVRIVAGQENLNDLTDEEIELGLDPHRRLACQCYIRAGEVKIEF